MEHTIATMRAPPQEPLVERSRTVKPSIPIQTMSFAAMGDVGPTLEAIAISALAVL